MKMLKTGPDNAVRFVASKYNPGPHRDPKMSKCDQPCEHYGADTQITPSYNQGASSFHPGSAWVGC